MKMLREEELQCEIGRYVGGSFIRVLHIPTGISRVKGPFGGESARSIEERFLREIEEELVAKGLTQYIVPSYRRSRHGK